MTRRYCMERVDELAIKGCLTPPQRECVAANVNDVLSGLTRLLSEMATGTGKTRTVPAIVEILEGYPMLWLAHQVELLIQAKKELEEVYGIPCSIIRAGEEVPPALVYMCTMQHAALGGHRGMYFKTVFIDEAHHAACDSYRKIISEVKPTFVFGMTATPIRTDNRSLFDTFEKVSFRYGLVDGVKDGFLVREIQAERVITNVDIRGVRVRAGEYDIGGLKARVVIPRRNKLVVDAYVRNVDVHKKAICFCVDIAHTRLMEKEFASRGILAASLDGTMSESERDGRVEAFRRGEVSVLCANKLCREGFDVPDVSTILMACPVRSIGPYLQMIGRGTRRYPGKDSMLIVDFVDVTDKFSLGDQMTIHRAVGSVKYAARHPVIKFGVGIVVDYTDVEMVELRKTTLISVGDNTIEHLFKEVRNLGIAYGRGRLTSEFVDMQLNRTGVITRLGGKERVMRVLDSMPKEITRDDYLFEAHRIFSKTDHAPGAGSRGEKHSQRKVLPGVWRKHCGPGFPKDILNHVEDWAKFRSELDVYRDVKLRDETIRITALRARRNQYITERDVMLPKRTIRRLFGSMDSLIGEVVKFMDRTYPNDKHSRKYQIGKVYEAATKDPVCAVA